MTRPEHDLTRSSENVLDSLSPPLRALAVELLLYKGVFMGEYFESLGREYEASDARDAFTTIIRETHEEARLMLEALEDWNRFPGAVKDIGPATHALRMRLFQDLLALKEGSNDVVLSTAMHAPTEDLRQRFVALADIDREHADRLRGLLGVRGLLERLGKHEAPKNERGLGAHEGRFTPGPLSRSVEAALHHLKESGHTPARLVVSPTALRHLRDEGVVDPDEGRAFGVAVDVEFGWEGECFSFITRDRVSLSEIITATRMER